MKQTISTVILAMAMAAVPAARINAQPQGPRPMPSVEQMAQQKTDEMDRELTLTAKQYKKILKYYTAEAEKEQAMMQANRPEGMPEGFPEGGRPDFGGGMPPMGGPQGGFGGGPQGGGPGGRPEMGGGRPPMGAPAMGVSDEEMEKFYEKQDKKLEKILTPEQYNRWRAKHPAGYLPMPEPVWK